MKKQVLLLVQAVQSFKPAVYQIQERFNLKQDRQFGIQVDARCKLLLEDNLPWDLRYNQALSNYVSFRLSNISPLFTDKNKSLQFYLRYNLWEDYRKRNSGKQ